MTRSVIYTSVPFCDPALLGAAGAFGIADLHEALGTVTGRQQLMKPQMRPIVPGARAVGQAVTAVAYPGDNLMMHQALALAREGQILVVTNGGGSDGALWGELAATYARRKGLAGVVMDGPVRDVDALTEMRFPVWATSVSPSHSEKAGPGAVNVPIVAGGVRVHPGDVIVADGDGVLAIPLACLQSAVEGARARADRENATRERIAQDAPLFAPEALKAALDRLGAVIHEGTWQDSARTDHEPHLR